MGVIISQKLEDHKRLLSCTSRVVAGKPPVVTEFKRAWKEWS
jgi:hypothetical protein